MDQKPHAVCIPYPTQGHINPMLKVAKLLHHKGFHITFVNTHDNHRRLIKSHGIAALSGFSDFKFTSIPDGLPPPDSDATHNLRSQCVSITNSGLVPFCEVLEDLNKNSPPLSFIVSDGLMTFTLKAAERFRLPEVIFWAAGACALLGGMMYKRLVNDGIIPLKDMGQVSNGYLETIIDWVPGSKGGLRLKDFPSFIRTTDRNDFALNFIIRETEALRKANAIILNTFDALEEQVLNALAEKLPPIYTIGPLNLCVNRLPDSPVKAIGSSLRKEERDYIKWLDDKEPGSVLYVNFGSSTVATMEQLIEFAWGLANSGCPFLWVIRKDIVFGESAVLPEEFLVATEDRSMLLSWIPQEKVLGHAAIGGFLTHSGWNSTIESISCGVPMICWPFFADQHTNCRFSCVEWGIGMEMEKDVKREEVEKLAREVMRGEKGKSMKEEAMKWKKKAKTVAAPGGASDVNFNRMIDEILKHHARPY